MELPKLREELSLYEAGHDWDGSPCWLIHDPTGNRYHRIGLLEFEFLSRWEISDPLLLLEQIHNETTLRPNEEELSTFIHFLDQNQLTQSHASEASIRLATRAAGTSQPLHQWLLHNYLFFRIPLLKPDRFLERIMPCIAPLFSTNALYFFLILGFGGFFLAARQWDVFVSSFANTLTPVGFLTYAIAITIAKCCHELGHAIAAKKAGLRVPRIGIAFLVMFPVLYTDLGEGWLLNDHRKRRLISLAGMLAEAALATFSLCIWGVLSPGELRDAMYIISVVSLTRSLVINVSPFMRFDGYYILSDHLNLPNLQQRAFAHTRHLVRQFIFGRYEEPDELLPRRLSFFFAIYSLATWLYRFIVFLGIAFAVYHYFFKSLGILLMLVELLYFIAFPIMKELITWRSRMLRVSTTRKVVMATFAAIILLVLFIPWRTRVTLAAILTTHGKQPLYAPFAARISKTSPTGKEVKKGELLFLLDADENRFQSRLASMQAMELRDRLRRLPVDMKGLEQANIWREEALEREQAVRSHSAELNRLELRADSAGILLDVDEGIKPGSYVTPHTLLGMVVAPSRTEVEAFADESSSTRIKTGAVVHFYSSNNQRKPLTGKVVSMDSNRLSTLPIPALADRHGGTVATVPSSGERLTPREGLYRVRIKLDTEEKFFNLILGTASVEAPPESFAIYLMRYAFSVMIRESGF